MSPRIPIVFLAWFVVALVVGFSGLLSKAHPPLPQIVLLLLTSAVLLWYWRGTAFRGWANSLPLRAFLMLHLTRFVGFYFLYLHSRGELPRAFAIPAGWGDIAVAAAALALLCAPSGAYDIRRSYLLWNALGLVDILFVVFTAARLALADPASMSSLMRLPLSLLLTFLVPLIIASHIILFIRLRAQRL